MGRDQLLRGLHCLAANKSASCVEAMLCLGLGSLHHCNLAVSRITVIEFIVPEINYKSSLLSVIVLY